MQTLEGLEGGYRPVRTSSSREVGTAGREANHNEATVMYRHAGLLRFRVRGIDNVCPEDVGRKVGKRMDTGYFAGREA
jgi:hypothetical protein